LTENIGKELPKNCFEILSPSSTPRKNLVIPLITVDETDFPHICLLSPFQIVAMASSEIYLMVYPSSHTRRNLDRTGRATLLIPELTGLLYVKGKLQYLREIDVSNDSSQCLYLMRILQVALDKSETAPINSNMTFDASIIGSHYQKSFEAMVKQIVSKTTEL
jgi:hypothetical protein